MDDEGTGQLESWAISHQLPPPKDYYIVCDKHERRFLQRRHGRDSRLKIEVLGVVSHDGRVQFVEEWP